MFDALKALDATVAMDDFGTGYSSLAYLQRLPIDVLKIDKSFVSGMMVDPDAVAIVRAVLSLAEALGMSTTAEGIETVELATTLATLGCASGQGFYFAKPLEAAAALDYWKSRASARFEQIAVASPVGGCAGRANVLSMLRTSAGCRMSGGCTPIRSTPSGAWRSAAAAASEESRRSARPARPGDHRAPASCRAGHRRPDAEVVLGKRDAAVCKRFASARARRATRARRNRRSDGR